MGVKCIYLRGKRHYTNIFRKTSFCGKRLFSADGNALFEHIEDAAQQNKFSQCPDCAAKTAAKAQAGQRAKAPKKTKPAIYSDNDLFEAIAAFCFKVTDKASFKAIGGRVAKIRLALCEYVLEKLGQPPTPEQTTKVIQRVKDMPDWYDKTCKGCDRPQSPDTFMTWYLRNVQSTNGTAGGEGDGYWYDGDRGAWMQRKAGIVYQQGKHIDDWESVK